MPRQINDAGIALMKKLHKFYATPYAVTIGKERAWAIGYGHVIAYVKDMVITEKQAEKYLREDLEESANFADRVITVPLNDNQFAAMVIFCCHVGSIIFESSLLLRLLNRGWYEQVPASLIRWSANGKNRVRKWYRSSESELWKTPDSIGSVTALGEEDAA